jgi:hypothetical protein
MVHRIEICIDLLTGYLEAGGLPNDAIEPIPVESNLLPKHKTNKQRNTEWLWFR